MFKKRIKLRFRNEHIKAIHAIITALGLEVKAYKKYSATYTEAIIKANEKDERNLITRLDKYGIERAYL